MEKHIQLPLTEELAKTPQLCMGQLIAWGQYVIGLGLAFAVLVPLFGVNAAFGNLLEIGFEGGHGTVAGLTKTFTDFNWEAGIATAALPCANRQVCCYAESSALYPAYYCAVLCGFFERHCLCLQITYHKGRQSSYADTRPQALAAQLL